jgi:hypothetical protein
MFGLVDESTLGPWDEIESSISLDDIEDLQTLEMTKLCHGQTVNDSVLACNFRYEVHTSLGFVGFRKYFRKS